ncbi:MAG: PDZ domain-containing protein [Bryobacterales bacterium]|nr:PDZ domain-containing protein [Bryobacterales bacterium]
MRSGIGFLTAAAVLGMGQSWALLVPQDPVPQEATVRSAHVSMERSGGYLGVGVAELSAERAKELKLPEERGVEIKHVALESPAAAAGIEAADVVLEYNGQRVEGLEQFMRLVRETPAGRQVRLSLWRAGAPATATPRLGERPSRRFVVNGKEIEIPEIRIPEIRIPDLPRPLMSWQSASLGIESESLGPQLAEYFGVKEGILVRSVEPGSAASQAGLKAGDVIVEVNGRKVAAPKEIAPVLRSAGRQGTVAFKIVRERRQSTLTVTLPQREER